MYIDKYWADDLKASDDNIKFIDFLLDLDVEEVSLHEIFARTGLDRLEWDFHDTEDMALGYVANDGIKVDFDLGIALVLQLAAILLEHRVNGHVRLSDLDSEVDAKRILRITLTSDENDALHEVIRDFVAHPTSYDLAKYCNDDELDDFVAKVEMIRKELFESKGRNRNYFIKAEDMQDLLKDWSDGEGCYASNRITVEGCKVGYCYREEPDGPWDSGWRFMAGDESDEYNEDPYNLSIYHLNTICNYDPEILKFLHTKAPCAFGRDHNGVFQREEF